MKSKSKRLLSILLALVMAFALFAGVGMGAAEETAAPVTPTAPIDNTPVGQFTDVTWANPYAEAIAVLGASGITSGTSDTTFGPKELVTREQVATFIARVGLGATQAGQLLAADTGFEDVARDDFYSKYIAYCRSIGAINGVNWEQTLYNPKGNVSGVQVLKMLLGVLNVDKVAELTGVMWETNTISYAIRLGLIDGVETEDYSAPATREQMAQYILNALNSAGYSNTGYADSVTGWTLIYHDYENSTGRYAARNEEVYPLYIRHNMSRRQTENTSLTDDGTVDPMKNGQYVTPYGELYYRWQYAANGRGITSWRHDDANEKILETVIATPETTGPLYNIFGTGKLNSVFKVYVNGAVVSAEGVGYISGNQTTTNTLSRMTTRDYKFNQALANAAINAICGRPNFLGTVTDETWTGATIKVYEQRLSGAGEYDLVTGQYGTGWDLWQTRDFDGKADKIVVTYEYLGEVAMKSSTNGSYTIYLDDAGRTGYDNEDNTSEMTNPGPITKLGGRSESTRTQINGVYGDFAIGDKVRVTPKLNTTNPTFLGGAYMDWLAYAIPGVVDSTEAIAGRWDGKFWNYNAPAAGALYSPSQPWFSNNVNIEDFNQPGAAVSKSIFSGFDVYKPDTKTITPTLYGYSYASNESSQTGTSRGHYISATQSGERTWISGTYQEILKSNNAELYADGTRYNVFLDKNGTILGGFSLSGGEYAVLAYPITNANRARSEWTWANSKAAEPRLMYYFDRSQFKRLVSTVTDRYTQTNSIAELYNGVLISGTNFEADAIAPVPQGTVTRLWGNYGKILYGRDEGNMEGGRLPANGALYVEITWDAFAQASRRYVFTAVTSTQAATNMKAANKWGETYTVYSYEDRDHTSFIEDYYVYVIDYTQGRVPTERFEMPYIIGKSLEDVRLSLTGLPGAVSTDATVRVGNYRLDWNPTTKQWEGVVPKPSPSQSPQSYPFTINGRDVQDANGDPVTVMVYSDGRVMLTLNGINYNTNTNTFNIALVGNIYTASVVDRPDDASISTILGIPVTAGGQAGTVASPKAINLTAPNTAVRLLTTDIGTVPGAIPELYTNATFAASALAPATGIELAEDLTIAYIKVIAANGVTTLYYEASITKNLLPQTFSVSGIISGSDAPAGLVGATVQLKNAGANVSAAVTTSANGAYTISGVPAANGYTIEVSMTGYTTGTIAAFDVTNADVTGKNLTLVKESATDIVNVSFAPGEGVDPNIYVYVTVNGSTNVSGEFYYWNTDGFWEKGISPVTNGTTNYAKLGSTISANSRWIFVRADSTSNVNTILDADIGGAECFDPTYDPSGENNVWTGSSM